MSIYQSFNDWRALLYDQIEYVHDDNLAVLISDLRQVIERLEQERVRRTVVVADALTDRGRNDPSH